jgi:uncharacterized protein
VNSPELWEHSTPDPVAVELPLFPLGTLLAPGGRLPLRVFEPRYVRLLRTVLDPATGTREFGVVGIRQGHEVGPATSATPVSLFAVGCTAHIDHLAANGESEFALLTTGRRRFELAGFHEAAGTPYLTGLVRYLNEPLGDPERALERRAKARIELTRYLEVLGGPDIDLPEDPVAASYRIAELNRLSLADRAELLAAATAEHRLALAARVLRREWTLFTRLRAVPWAGPTS